MTEWVERFEALQRFLPYLKPLVDIPVIPVFAWVAVAMLRRLLRTTGERLARESADPEARQRTHTMLQALQRVAAGVVYPTPAMLLLSQLGVSIAPLLATARVAGIQASSIRSPGPGTRTPSACVQVTGACASQATVLSVGAGLRSSGPRLHSRVIALGSENVVQTNPAWFNLAGGLLPPGHFRDVSPRPGGPEAARHLLA